MRYNDTVCNLVSKEFRGINHVEKGEKRRKVIAIRTERLFESNKLYHRCDYNGEGAARIVRVAVIRASVNVTKYNRILELSTPGIPFTLYDNWMREGSLG